MYHNFSNNISVSISVKFSERMIDLENDSFLWNYDIKLKNYSDKHIRITEILFSTINEFGKENYNIYEKLNDKNVVIKPMSSINRQGTILTLYHSVIVFGKIFAFDEIGNDTVIELPTFSLDSPYYFYKNIH